MGILARAAEEGKDDGKGSAEPSFTEFISDAEEVEACEEDTDSGEGMRVDTDSTRRHLKPGGTRGLSNWEGDKKLYAGSPL